MFPHFLYGPFRRKMMVENHKGLWGTSVIWTKVWESYIWSVALLSFASIPVEKPKNGDTYILTQRSQKKNK